MNQDTPLILSLFPNARGLGYVCIEAPKKLLDFGVVTIRPVSNERILARINKFVEFHRPTVIVIRQSQTFTARRAMRVQAVISKITDYAKTQNLPVHRYTRQQIRDVFEVQGAKTKQEIAKQIAQWFPELAPRLPKVRKIWMDEDYNMVVFDAAALAITHMYLMQ
jgi:Holliday junction resolvasome RuvABC endonuclease subunit